MGVDLRRRFGVDRGRLTAYEDERLTRTGTAGAHDSEDGEGRAWTTVGVSANVIDASFDALVDAIAWKLVRDGAPVPR